MDLTRLEGAHGYGAFIWHSGGIPLELITVQLDKVNKNGDL